MRSIILIPARMSSSRLPNKPLALISGQPMIIHVLDRAKEANIGDVYVACAENEILTCVENYGGKAILTNADLPSGTDRIYEALCKIESSPDFTTDYEIIINVQGDLPTIDPQIIKDVLIPFQNNDVDISTLVCEINDTDEINNPNVVKAVVNWHNENAHCGIAHDFSRKPKQASDGKYYHHIGLYAYRKKSLKQFVQYPTSKRELTEKLEQLRALDNGMRIDAVKVNTIPIGVDTEEDLNKVRNILS